MVPYQVLVVDNSTIKEEGARVAFEPGACDLYSVFC